MNVRCEGCRGNVVISGAATGDVRCPNCERIVAKVDAQTNTIWTPKREPTWFLPSGWFCVAFGTLIFCLSAYLGPLKGQRTIDLKDLVAAWAIGLINPFFICYPVGIYWLRHAPVSKAVGKTSGSRTQAIAILSLVVGFYTLGSSVFGGPKYGKVLFLLGSACLLLGVGWLFRGNQITEVERHAAAAANAADKKNEERC